MNRARKPFVLGNEVKYFQNIKNEILNEFKMKELLSSSKKNSSINVNVEEMENGRFGVKKRIHSVDFHHFLTGLEAGKGNCAYLNTQYQSAADTGIDDDDDDQDSAVLTQVLTTPLDVILREKKHLISLPQEFIAPLIGLQLQQMTLWMGGNDQSTSSGLHHDFHDNLYILLEGQKQFTVYPPSDYKYLYLNSEPRHLYDNGLFVYGVGGKEAPLAIRSDGSFAKDALEWKLGKLEDIQDDPHSSQKQKQAAKKEFKKLYEEWERFEEDETAPDEDLSNSDPPSFSKIPPSVLRSPHTAAEAGFPLLSKASPTTFTLKAGDALFLPCGWFHEVVSTSSTIEVQDRSYRYHAALNYWYAPPDADEEDRKGGRRYKDNYLQETFGQYLDQELAQLQREG